MTPIVLCRQNKFVFNRYMYKNVYLKKWPQPLLSKSYFDQQCPTLTPKNHHFWWLTFHILVYHSHELTFVFHRRPSSGIDRCTEAQKADAVSFLTLQIRFDIVKMPRVGIMNFTSFHSPKNATYQIWLRID